jgi:Zn-dependent protease
MAAGLGGFRIARLFGVDVYLHWSWAVVALIEIQTRRNTYESQVFNIAEYLTLFVIVLAHELGHALACRSVGGRADRIVLWPLGGIAYVQPPPRPGALLWSIAAGPLVNLVLALATLPLALGVGLLHLSHDVRQFVVALCAINVVLFCFNMLPVYPLDGGQILQALLWFIVGRARSLLAVSVVGMAGAGVFFVVALSRGSIWFSVIAVYAALRAFAGMRQARLLAAAASAPRRPGVACPRCRAAPPVGDFWFCACRNRFDTFATRGVCPSCARAFAQTVCLECQQASPHEAFYAPATNASSQVSGSAAPA